MLYKFLINSGLTESEAKQMASIFKDNITLEKDEYFHKENQICNKIGFITDGICRYFYNSEKEEITRWVTLDNEFVTSLSSLITQLPSLENIQAIKKTEILVATKNDWSNLYDKENFAKQFWVKTIEYNYIGMENRVFNLIAMTAEERYAWMLKHQPRFNQLVPDKYIASMLGIQPRHLSRIRSYKK
jgi:CRP/FNR family transcriptional regulator, anaerobic regulatory protein